MPVRDPWGLNERLFAWYYPRLMGLSERAGGTQLRARAVDSAAGRTLEIGAGNGYHLPHYSPAVTELVITEPSPYMVELLRRRLAEAPPAVGAWRLQQTGAEELPFPDASFDTVTSGYVLCTAPAPERVLDQIARVLKPGGRYLFLEHVRAQDGSLLGRVQDLIEPVHVYVAAGCHPNRRTEELIRRSPLELKQLEHHSMPRSSPSVRPVILGSASKPGQKT